MNEKKKKTGIPTRYKKYAQGYLFLVPNFLGFFLFMFIPIIMGFGISLTDYDGFQKMNFVGIKNYIDMFRDSYFLVSLKNNFLYTLVTVPATIVLAILLAVALNTGIKGMSAFKAFYYFPSISSMVAVGIVWSVLFNPMNGPINSLLQGLGMEDPPKWLASTSMALWAVMIVAVWKQTGYYMVMLLAGLQSIPKQLYEAAEIDGANAVVRFFKITLPMLSPVTFMVTILTIISSFQVFDLINVMTKGGPGYATNVLVYRIYQEGFKYMRYGYASAMAYFLFLIILIITLIQFRGQKKWVTYM